MLNFIAFITMILPPKLRGGRIVAFLKALSAPAQSLSNELNKVLPFSSQTASFEAYLNGLYSLPYDYNNRATLIASASIIYIQDTTDTEEVYLYNSAELQPPAFVYNSSEVAQPLYLYNSSDPTNTFEFIVLVPVSLAFDLDQMAAQIRRLVTAAKRFTIITY